MLSRREFSRPLIASVVAGISLERSGKLFAQPIQRDFNATAIMSDLISNANNGDRLNIPAGEWTIGTEQIFVQNDITLNFAVGASIKQAKNTENIDTLIKFTGDRGKILNLNVGGNAAQNTRRQGRGELVKIMGDQWLVEDMFATGTVTSANAFALFITGSHCTVRRFTSKNTGRGAIRNKGDYNRFEDVKMLDWAIKGFVMDAQTSTRMQRVDIDRLSAITSKTTAEEGLLIDPDMRQMGYALVRDINIETPNSSSANNIKFAYVRHIEIEGLRSVIRPNPFNCSLRFQQSIERISIINADLGGCINFDSTEGASTSIGGSSKIAKSVVSASAIQDIWGDLTIEDGVELHAKDQFIAIDPSKRPAANSTVKLGRLKYYASGGGKPSILRRGPRLYNKGSNLAKLTIAGLGFNQPR